MNNCGSVDSRIAPYKPPPLEGGAPQGRRGHGGRLWHGIEQQRIGKLHLISLGLWPIQLPLKVGAFGRIPCPYTVCKPSAFTEFRREQAPALRYEVGLRARRGGYQPPANVAIGAMSPEEAIGMMRWCIHSLSLGLWPIQLSRRGSLGYVLLFLAPSYLYRP